MKVMIPPRNPAQNVAARTTQQVSKKTSNAALRTEASAPIDPVLGDAQTNLDAMPEIDTARVEAMKQAIDAGKFSVNLDDLTQSIQDYYKG